MTDIAPLDHGYAEHVLAEAAIAGLLDALAGRVVAEEELDRALAVPGVSGPSEPSAAPGAE